MFFAHKYKEIKPNNTLCYLTIEYILSVERLGIQSILTLIVLKNS